MDEQDLRRRYLALGRIEEVPGGRTFLGRCDSWEGFLRYAPLFDRELREHGDELAFEREVAPGLCARAGGLPGQWRGT